MNYVETMLGLFVALCCTAIFVGVRAWPAAVMMGGWIVYFAVLSAILASQEKS